MNLTKPPSSVDIYEYTTLINDVNVAVTWYYNPVNGFWYLAAKEVISGKQLCDYSKVINGNVLFTIGEYYAVARSGKIRYTKELADVTVSLRVAKPNLKVKYTRLF